MPHTHYDGYKSYSYLTPVEDYEVFDLADELGRVPEYDLSLAEDETERTQQLLRDSIVISLHDHPQIFPRNITEVRDYVRSGREHTGYEALSRSGLTAVFDNMMDGTACVTSKWGWKWDDIIYDIGMRLCDMAHQDFLRPAYSVADIQAAQETGRIATCSASKRQPRSRTRLTGSTSCTGSGYGRSASHIRSPIPSARG